MMMIHLACTKIQGTCYLKLGCRYSDHQTVKKSEDQKTKQESPMNVTAFIIG